MLPVLLPGAGVQVLVAGRYVPLYYVSPKQVNFLIPSDLRPGEWTLQLLRASSLLQDYRLLENAIVPLKRLSRTAPVMVSARPPSALRVS